MRLALFQGTSFISGLIRDITRSKYSHAALVFDGPAAMVARDMAQNGILPPRLKCFDVGAIIEAWEGKDGVQNNVSISTLHEPGTIVDLFDYSNPLTAQENMDLITEAARHIGEPYDYKNVFRFLSKQAGEFNPDAWFCSELVCYCSNKIQRQLFRRFMPEEIPPHLIQGSLALIECGSETTS